MYTPLGLVIGAILGCIAMAVCDVGALMGFAGVAAGGAIGALVDALPRRRSRYSMIG